MSQSRNDILQGTLTLLVLRTLAVRGASHGYGLCGAIQAASCGLLRVEEGSLYPALHRMTQERLLKARWGLSEKGRRARFYELTARGRARLEAERQGWERLTRGVALVLATG